MPQKSFPRGGKNVPEEKSSNLLFRKYEKIDKKNHKKDKAKTENEEEEEGNFLFDSADRLSYATISEGLTVLGCIFEVTEYDLMISLPGGVIGRAQITDISDSYTNFLQNLITSEDSQTNEFKRLPELYSCGEYVACYVKSVQLQEKWQITISLEPKLINQTLNINHINNGTKIVCAISSIEDHGYVVDIGVPNVRAFIPAKDSTNEKCLFPGKQLLCHVKEVKTSENNSIIRLSAKQKLVKAIHETEIQSLDSLLPGVTCNLFIKKVLSNGLCVSFGNNYVGYVNQLYLDQHLSKYSKGMEITGVLLYILPTVKFAYFSTVIDKPKDNTIKSGDVIGEATALFRESGGIVLQLSKNGIRGFVPLKRTNVDYDKIIEKFSPGSTHKCRVLSFNWMDRTYVCTMQRSLLEEKYFSLSDFKPGDVVNVKIKSINEETGFIDVEIGMFNGQVSPEHVSDEGLSSLKKLNINKEVEARVLTVDTKCHRVYLTLKKSLITSDLPILTDIKDAKYGAKYYGTIVQINRYGLLVKFFGEVKGWVPKVAFDDEASDVNWNYSIGQTVLVKIESVNEDLGKILLSIDTKKTKVEEVKFAIGEQVEGTITESSTQGVYLRISKNGGRSIITGFLPAGHMSPCMESAALLASKCMPGDTLSALVFSMVPSLILTRTFIPQEKYRNFEKLKIGDCIPCSIRDIEADGIKVILPVTGCSPFGCVSYSNVSNFNLLCMNQILFAKVMFINRKERQLGLTLSLKKIFDGLPNPRSRITIAVDTLSMYFNKLAELMKNSFYENRPISSVKLGQRVVGKIEKITNDGLVIQLPNNLLGIVSKDHYIKERKVGDKISGTVMWKNYVHELVDLTTLPTVRNNISAKQNKQLRFSEGKLLRGRILMVNNWFLLILLKGIGKGTLAAMPTRRHMNDVKPDLSPYSVHAKIRCYVLLNSNESDIMPICIVKSAFEKKYYKQTEPKEDNNLKRKTKATKNNEVPAKKIKTEEGEVPVKKEVSEEELEKVLEENNSVKANIKQKRQKKLKKCKQEEEIKSTGEDIKNIRYDIEEVSEEELEKVLEENNSVKANIKQKRQKKLKKCKQEEEIKSTGEDIKNIRYDIEEVSEEELEKVIEENNSVKANIKQKRQKKLKKCKQEEEIKSTGEDIKNIRYDIEEVSEEELEKVLEENNSVKANIKQKSQKKLKKRKQEEKVKPTEEDIKNIRYDIYNNYKDNEEKPRIPECGFFWDNKPDVTLLKKEESSSDSEEEKEQEPKQKKKKLSAAERREQERQKEREIRQREEALASNQLPNSVDQFDRLVLASPDSSIIWLQYMAYHLQTTEIEKARAVARRAVKTINFREENERLNVWNAWLNLESKFGTSESLNDVFQEAVRSNDALKIYTHMLTVHAEANRQIELNKIINTMIGKFKQNPQIWIDCGATLLKVGLKDKSRHIMQRALQSLPASEHVNLLARFAILENKFGDKERSQTLFEQILSSYPKRVDIWSCYVDSLTKSNDIDIARKVLERAIVQTLPPRKMKSLFKKFISFEEQHGTQESVTHVQQMAVEYVEKQCNKDA